MKKNYSLLHLKNNYQVISFCFVLCLGILKSTISFAQPTFQWAKQISGTDAVDPTSIVTDAVGNVYTAGSFIGTADFDPGVGTYTLTSVVDDIFITKFDASGNFIWAKKMSGASSEFASSISIDSNGDLCITGRFYGTVDFDPGITTFTLTSFGTGPSDIFVAKLNASGSFLWAKQMGGVSFDVANSIVTDASGNIYTTGYFFGTTPVDFDPGLGVYNLTATDDFDTFISKLDINGNFVWAKQITGANQNNEGKSIRIDGANNIYISGYFSGTSVDFDPDVATYSLSVTAGNIDGYILKLDNSGNFVWVKQLKSITGTGSYLDINSTAINSGGEMYLVGHFSKTFDFDPSGGAQNLTSLGSDDVFILKLDNSGNFSWIKQLGTVNKEFGNALTIDASNNLYIAGAFVGTIDINPDAAILNMTSTGSSYDMFYLKLDNAGNFVSANQIGGNNTDYPWSITTGNFGDIYSTGTFRSVVDFDFGSGVNNLTATGSSTNTNNGFVLKMNDCLSAPAAPTSSTAVVNQTICSGLATTLSATSIGSINWYASSTSTTSIGTGSLYVTPLLSAGTYTYYAEAYTCTVSATRTPITVTVNTLPTISVNSGAICSGNSFSITPTGATTYTVTGGLFNVSPTSTTSYSVIGTSTQGCLSSNTAVSSVTVNSIPTITVNSGAICSGKTFTINPNGAGTYTVTGGQFNVSPTTTTSYSISGTSVQGCLSSNTAVSSVTVNSIPTITVNSGSICSGKTFTINPTGANTYTVTGGLFNVSPTTTTSYSISGTSIQGCLSSNTAVSSVTVNSNPTVTINSTHTLLCTGQTASLTAQGATSYSWSTGSINSVLAVNPSATTTYTIIGTNNNNCSNSASYTQQVSLCTGIESIDHNDIIVLYPNPNNGLFSIDLTTQTQILILNNLGEVLMDQKLEKGNQVIDIQNEATGMYLIKFVSTNAQHSFKFIKN